jgi:dTDP-4-amino-4,6-dideoxygalactose transaminase
MDHVRAEGAHLLMTKPYGEEMPPPNAAEKRLIPCADPKAQYLTYKTEIEAAMHRVLDGGRYVLGAEVASFEDEFASYLGGGHSVGVGSGTEAVHLALAALGVGPGDEVITVSHTAVATVAAIELAGATPVLVDIEPGTYTIDPKKVEDALTPKTKAVVAVHIYGHPADLDALTDLCRRKGVKLVEDCAQSHGATWKGRRTGSLGDAAAFSFYPTKNLGAIGDGGAVFFKDKASSDKARLLREYGWAERYVSAIPGLNSRLDELQAAILRVKLRGLDADNTKRRALAAVYREVLGGLPGLPAERPEAVPVYHLFVIAHPERDALKAALQERGVGTMIHYPMPIHLQPAYRGRVPVRGTMTVTERAAREVLSLPMFPELPESDARRCAQALTSCVAALRTK